MYTTLERAMLVWFSQNRTQNVPINRPMMQSKVNESSLRFSIQNLKCSSGWLECYKVCHEMSSNKVVGESTLVDPKPVSEWLLLLRNILSHYQPRDVHKVDKEGIVRVPPATTTKDPDDSQPVYIEPQSSPSTAPQADPSIELQADPPMEPQVDPPTDLQPGSSTVPLSASAIRRGNMAKISSKLYESSDEEEEKEMKEETEDLPTTKNVLQAGDVYARALAKRCGSSFIIVALICDIRDLGMEGGEEHWDLVGMQSTKLRLFNNQNYALRVSIVCEKAVLKQGQTTHTTKRKRGRPRGRPATKKVNAISRKSTQYISTRSTPLERKRKRNISPKYISVLPKKLAKVSTGTMLNGKILKESDTSSNEEDNFVKTVIIKEENKCFVCENQVSDGTPLGTLTTTSRATMRNKLYRISEGARGHLDLSHDPGGVLCSHCTSVLNHLDQIEVELNSLTKSVLNALLKNYDRHLRLNLKVSSVDKLARTWTVGTWNVRVLYGDVDENIGGTYLENVEYVENTINHSNEALTTPKDQCIDQINNLNIKEELPSQEYHCRICFYTCNKKSLLVFHLRDHLKRNCHRCDFCNLYIEEGDLHNHGNKQHVKPYVKEMIILARKATANIQGCPKQVASATPKVLNVSENQANDTSVSKESSNDRRSQNFLCGVLGGRPVKESKDSFNVGLDNDIVRKRVTFSELDYVTDVSFVTLPRTRQPPYIINSTFSDLSEKHELEILDYISSKMSSIIKTESDTIESVLGDSEVPGSCEMHLWLARVISQWKGEVWRERPISTSDLSSVFDTMGKASVRSKTLANYHVS
uniref:HTH CENPB-type domain-containing protein n=1 Tax=Timema monikensis TaxID=170555 RepID=A0A7R9DYC2_9NEOP|nr:unnamed protein product [Timema monikensis]